MRRWRDRHRAIKAPVPPASQPQTGHTPSVEPEGPQEAAQRASEPYPEGYTRRLRELLDDFDGHEVLPDPAWRHQMQRAVLVEIEVEWRRLWRVVDD